MSKARPAALALLLACTAFAAPPPDVAALGAVFAGGALDLMTEPRRDVTASFGALVSAPIGYPQEKRAAVYSFLHLALPAAVRARQPQLSTDNPALAALCVQPDGDGRFKLEGLVTGRTRLWVMSLAAWTNMFDAPDAAAHPPAFLFAGVAPIEKTLAQHLEARGAAGFTCQKVQRDAAGEIVLEGAPVRFEAPMGTPWPSGSDHLLDFVDDPDGAVGGLMPVEIFANLHRELPRPRAAGVLSLIGASEALGKLNSLTVVAMPPTPTGTAVLFTEGRATVIIVGFSNGYFTPVQQLPAAQALKGKWSKWSWSMFKQGMPAELLLDMSPASAACLDGLPKTADEAIATTVQRCFDLSLADAGPTFRARRERWLEAARAHELSTDARIDAFCADQAALAALPFFQPLKGAKQRDAGPLLTATLGWEKGKPGSLKLSAELEKQFSLSGFMELSDKDLAAAAGTDTSFFSRLGEFDRWELAEGKGPLVAANTLNAAAAPLPEFGKLTLAARLHLRRALKTGKLLEASLGVRQAARLAFSTETLVGQATGLSLLTIERRASDWSRKHTRPFAAVVPFDEDTLARVRRVLRTAAAFSSPLTKDETRAKAWACERVTSCAALTEVVAVSAGLESLLREPWRGRYGAVLETIAKPHERCSFALARHWSTRPMVDIAEAKRSRTQEVIAGAMMARAAEAFYLRELETAYPPP